MWLKEFKIALVEDNVAKMDELLDTMPQFETLEDLQEAQYLIANAFKDATEQKNRISKILDEIKKSSSFMESSYDTKSYKLNIRS